MSEYKTERVILYESRGQHLIPKDKYDIFRIIVLTKAFRGELVS